MKKLLMLLIVTTSLQAKANDIEILDTCANTGTYLPEFRKNCVGVAELMTKVYGNGIFMRDMKMHEACYKVCMDPVKYYMVVRKTLSKED